MGSKYTLPYPVVEYLFQKYVGASALAHGCEQILQLTQSCQYNLRSQLKKLNRSKF